MIEIFRIYFLYPLVDVYDKLHSLDPDLSKDRFNLYLDGFLMHPAVSFLSNCLDYYSDVWRNFTRRAIAKNNKVISMHLAEASSGDIKKLGVEYIRTISNWDNTDFDCEYLIYNLVGKEKNKLLEN